MSDKKDSLSTETAGIGRRRFINTAALAGLIGRGALGWDGLLADAGYQAARSRLPPASLA